MSRSAGGAPARVASCRASTPSRCCCCGRAAECRRPPVRPGSSAWIDARDRRADPVRPDAAGVAVPGEATSRPDSGSGNGDLPDAAGEPDRGDLDRSRDERVARMIEGPDRARPLAGRPDAHRARRPGAGALRHLGRARGAARRRPRRCARQSGSASRRPRRCRARLALPTCSPSSGCCTSSPRPAGGCPTLPGNLADVVATVSGWQVRQADVLASVPETDDWIVMGRSDTREDRIEVRRTWLRGRQSRRWAMLLSFAAYRQSLDDSWVGRLHRPCRPAPLSGRLAALPRQPPLRRARLRTRRSSGLTLAEACAEIGFAVAAEPWLEHVPVSVRAAPTIGDGRWVLTDATGSLPLLGGPGRDRGRAGRVRGRAGHDHRRVDAAGAGAAHVSISATASIDVGPRADPSFVGAA